MKRKSIISVMYIAIVVSTLLLLAVILGPALYWRSLPTTPLKVWIMDKTVPQPDYREHKGLMWILNYLKFSKEDKEQFRYDKDFFGFFPGEGESYKVSELPDVKENPDLIYITDTYGVYTDDLNNTKVSGKESDLVYGGLQKKEVAAVKQNLGKGNTLIGEFNIVSAPTNTLNRKEMEKIFGVHWKGWKGRYFKDLDKSGEVNEWIMESYEKQYGKPWNFIGEGFIFISDEEKILVLEGTKHIGNKALSIAYEKTYAKEFNIDKEIPYYYWFEITQADPDVETIASYKMDLTEAGTKIFEENGLSQTFPAVMRFKNSQYTSYYFAGDFADLKNVSKYWSYGGLAEIKRIFSQKVKGDEEYFYWNCYVPMMKKIIGDVKERKTALAAANPEERATKITSRTNQKSFEVYKDNKWQELFIKGVNIGAAEPGKWFTEFPEDKETYLHWFEMIGNMNANTLRVYTLLPPEFYSALKHYNERHKDNPLYLLQEIWPEENPEAGNYLDKAYEEQYRREIELDIDAVHGTAYIPERKGRAYGSYTADVSDYVLGYLVGRELEPEEVVNTNELNSGYSYKGEYLSAEETASPTEAWLAMNCDYTIKYESQKYNTQHPAAIVSWPTLDTVEHDSEWNVKGNKSLEYNDRVSVNINNIKREGKNEAGFFGAYHIYPNYPDFMNNELKYESYSDEEGTFRYGGYLKEFIEGHTKYPALVAEFGLATGMGNAHTNPDGYNHGGMTEEQQGEGVVRMIKAIKNEGYAGGIVFEWMDEWAKKTWITEPFMIPYDRHALWHNVVDPEQNYGILAFETKKPEKAEYSLQGNGEIKSIEMSKDEAFLYLDITLGNNFEAENNKLLIGLDTYDRSSGEFKYSPSIDISSQSGMEFLIEISSKDTSKLLVHPGYNIYSSRYSSYNSSSGVFEEIKSIINKARVTKDGRTTPQFDQHGSRLVYGEFKDNVHNYWYAEGNKVHIRIPWLRLNFSDPSAMKVINDDRKIESPVKDQLNTVTSDGVIPSALLVNTADNRVLAEINTSGVNSDPYTWKNWESPNYVERLKKSYDIIRKYFEKLK
jgi:hypothetical protein